MATKDDLRNIDMATKDDLQNALAKMTNIPAAEIRVIYDRAVENIRILNSCAGPHQFEPMEPGKLASKCRCKLCGGTVESSAKRWYEKGLEHGRRPGKV